MATPTEKAMNSVGAQEPRPVFYVYQVGKEIPASGQIGGKARNLAVLQKHGMPVPPWLVLSVEAFDEFLGDGLREFRQMLAAPVTLATVEEWSRSLQEQILARPFPASLRETLESQVKLRFPAPEKTFFAVRSSATDEDSARFSFAGQMESYLYQRFGEDLVEAVKRCFASAFSHRAMVYRLHQGLPILGVRPAVIIQEMVFGEVSGVAFTGHPLTRNPYHLLVNATYGLGEGIVSGELDADSWVLDRNGTIVTRTICQKDAMIVFDEAAGEGTCKAAVPEAQRSVPSLSDAVLKELAARFRVIETDVYRGVPQDIEWCVRDGEIFILQSRPVTTLAHINTLEELTIFDNSNVIESYSGVTSPLTYSFITRSFYGSYKGWIRSVNVPEHTVQALEPVLRNMLGYVNGRVYYNLLNWYRMLMVLPGYEENIRYHEQMIGVKMAFDLSETRAEGLWANVVHGFEQWRIRATMFTTLLFFESVSARFTKNFYRKVGHYLDEDFHRYSNRQLMEIFHEVLINCGHNWNAEIMNAVGTMIAFGKLKRFVTALEIPDVDAVQNDLLVAEGDIASTKPTQEIIKISEWLRARPEFFELFVSEPEERLMALILNSQEERFAELRGMLRSYIREYGFRAMNELKLEESTIREDPTFLFTMLKNYLKREAADIGRLQGADRQVRERAEALVFGKCPPLKRWKLKRLLKRARYHVKKREELRFLRTKYFGIERSVFNAIGRHFQKAGLIESAKDIFFFKVDELQEMVEGRSPDVVYLRELLALRKREQAENLKKESTERLYFYGDLAEQRYVEVLSEVEVALGAESADPDVFKGTPCGPGLVEGQAKVVLSSDEATLNGEILVTKRTDPGWIPLFPSISGLLIERGSVLSHSAVIAREMGIPTVVGLRKITDKVKTGVVLRINGGSGVVERVKGGGSGAVESKEANAQAGSAPASLASGK
jgi:pyruvate,water dikinase